MTNTELRAAIAQGEKEGTAFQFGSTRGYDMPLYGCYGISFNNQLIAVCFNNEKGEAIWLINFGTGNRYATRIARQIEKEAFRCSLYYETDAFCDALRHKFDIRTLW